MCYSNLSVRDIRVNLNIPIEMIQEASKYVISTVGEWELIDINAHKEMHQHEEAIDELVFQVC